MTSCWGCDNGLVEESLLRNRRDIPFLFFYDDATQLDENKLNKHLKDFQTLIVVRALEHGRYGLFADNGLGKTLMQLEWSHQVILKTDKPVLILAPLAVVEQTIREAQLFLEEQILAQLNLVVEFEFPASLENELISDNNKDAETGATQPNDTTAGSGE